LSEALRNKVCFVLVDASVSLAFEPKYPFAADDVSTGGA